MVEGVITRKKHKCCVRTQILEVVADILVEGVARLSGTWGVWCGCNILEVVRVECDEKLRSNITNCSMDLMCMIAVIRERKPTIWTVLYS